jgi:transcriptional regulator with XRE-family HTH domain|nr:MAG TPA: Repressor protein CI [Bacteriophage sp.]
MYENYCNLRDARGMRDADVSRETGIGKSTFSDWKSGRSTPKNDKLEKIAKLFGVTVGELINGKEDQSNVSEIKDPDLKEEYLNLEKLLLSGKQKPLYFDGKPADKESIELLLQQVRISIALLEKSKE